MEVLTKDLRFPVLIFNPRRRGGIGVFRSAADMIERADLLSVWPPRKYRLVTDDFQEYQVIRPVILGGAHPFWGLRFGLPFGIFRKLRFDMVVCLQKTLQLSEVVDLLCRGLEYDRETVEGFRNGLIAEASQARFGAAGLYDLSVRRSEALYDQKVGRARPKRGPVV